MPRPQNKVDLLKQSNLNYTRLIDFVDGMAVKEQHREFPKGTMNRNIRDVLAHLHQWHLMMLNWHSVGSSGQMPHIPAEGYTWKTTPELNKKIWQDYQNVELNTIKQKLEKSHLAVQEVIQKHSNDELFEKKRYKWTGSTSLGAYLISATSSHYDWAFKLIKKAKK